MLVFEKVRTITQRSPVQKMRTWGYKRCSLHRREHIIWKTMKISRGCFQRLLVRKKGSVTAKGCQIRMRSERIVSKHRYMCGYVRGAQVWAAVREDARACMGMYDYARVCASMHRYAQLLAGMHDYARVCTGMCEYGMHGYTWACTSMREYVQVGGDASMPRYARVCEYAEVGARICVSARVCAGMREYARVCASTRRYA